MTVRNVIHIFGTAFRRWSDTIYIKAVSMKSLHTYLRDWIVKTTSSDHIETRAEKLALRPLTLTQREHGKMDPLTSVQTASSVNLI